MREPRTQVPFNLYSDQVRILSDMANETGEARTAIFRRILRWYIHREVAAKEAKARREERLRKLIEEGM